MQQHLVQSENLWPTRAFFGFFVWIYIFRKPEKKIKTYEVEIIVDDVLDQIEAKNFITLKIIEHF